MRLLRVRGGHRTLAQELRYRLKVFDQMPIITTVQTAFSDRTANTALRIAQLVGIALLLACVSWAGIALTREYGRVATIWPANGILIGLLLRTSLRRWPSFMAAGFAGNFVADFLTGDPLALAVGLTFCNSLEVLLAAWPIHCLVRNDLDPVKLAASARRIIAWVLLAPVVPGALAGLMLVGAAGASFLDIVAVWYPADMLGIVLMTPFVLAVNRRVAQRLFGPRRLATLLSLAFLGAITVGVFCQDTLPLLFLTFPPLLWVVFRLGLAGAALGLILMSGIAVLFTLHGHGPLALVHAASIPERILLLQFFVAVASLMAYPVGVVLTERQRLQQTLAESERRFRTFSEHSSDVIIRAGMDGSRHYVSPSVVEILGWSADATQGDMRLDCIHPEDRAGYLRELAAMQGGKRDSTLAYRFRHKDGHYVWLESKCRVVPGTGPDGQDEIIKVVRDISRRKEVEDALAKSERDLRAVTDNLPVLIAFIDTHRIVRFCNATHEEWLGYSNQHLLGCHLSELLGPQAYAEQLDVFARALQGERGEFDLTLNHGGRPRYARVTYMPRRAENGAVTGIYSLTMDLTAIKTAEQQLMRLARHDTLTGLPNRYQFNERLEQALARARRTGHALAVMFLDIDHFKTINDTQGHAIGDEVLQEFGRRVHGCVRATDMIARLAGDEFVAVVENMRTPEESQFVARKILRAVGEPFESSAGAMDVTTSIGIAFIRDGSTPAAEALHMADTALYEVKAHGRNAFRLVADAPLAQSA